MWAQVEKCRVSIKLNESFHQKLRKDFETFLVKILVHSLVEIQNFSSWMIDINPDTNETKLRVSSLRVSRKQVQSMNVIRNWIVVLVLWFKMLWGHGFVRNVGCSFICSITGSGERENQTRVERYSAQPQQQWSFSTPKQPHDST